MALTVLVCSPPPTAVGGIATHTKILCTHLPGARLFDQWWPLTDRHENAAVRALVHGLALARLGAAVLRRRPDVVHLQVSEPGLSRDAAHAALCRSLGIPVVAHLHSEFRSDAMARLALLARHTDQFVSLSEHTRERLLDALPQVRPWQVHVAPNPVDPVHLTSPVPVRGRAGDLGLVMVGLICPLKNQLEVARAVSRLRREGAPVRLTLVGPAGPDLPAKDLQELRATEGVRLAGARHGTELVDELDAADALVLFSTSEGEPLVVLEAMARGLPVVASDVGAVSGMLPAARHNVVVPAGSTLLLEEAIRALGADRAGLAATGARNRHHVVQGRRADEHVRLLTEVHELAVRGPQVGTRPGGR